MRTLERLHLSYCFLSIQKKQDNNLNLNTRQLVSL